MAMLSLLLQRKVAEMVRAYRGSDERGEVREEDGMDRPIARDILFLRGVPARSR